MCFRCVESCASWPTKVLESSSSELIFSNLDSIQTELNSILFQCICVKQHQPLASLLRGAGSVVGGGGGEMAANFIQSVATCFYLVCLATNSYLSAYSPLVSVRSWHTPATVRWRPMIAFEGNKNHCKINSNHSSFS